MNERQRRGGGRSRSSRESREFNQGRWGHDDPWREERGYRYPDESYGHERDTARDFGRRDPGGRGWTEREPWRDSGYRTNWQMGSEGGWEDIGRTNDRGWTGRRSADDPGSWDRERASDYRAGDSSIGRAAREDFRGRAPKDYRRSDDRIREEICDRFTDDWELDPSEVTVKVEGCDVTLTGTVADRDQKRRAEDIAERTTGVRDVINQIRVSRGDTTSGMTPGQPGRARGSVAADRDRER